MKMKHVFHLGHNYTYYQPWPGPYTTLPSRSLVVTCGIQRKSFPRETILILVRIAERIAPLLLYSSIISALAYRCWLVMYIIAPIPTTTRRIKDHITIPHVVDESLRRCLSARSQDIVAHVSISLFIFLSIAKKTF